MSSLIHPSPTTWTMHMEDASDRISPRMFHRRNLPSANCSPRIISSRSLTSWTVTLPLLKRLYFSHPDDDDRSCLVLCGLQCPFLYSNPSVRLSTVDARRDNFTYDNREWSLVDLGGQVGFVQPLLHTYHDDNTFCACRFTWGHHGKFLRRKRACYYL